MSKRWMRFNAVLQRVEKAVFGLGAALFAVQILH